MEKKEKEAFKIASYLLQYPDSNWYESIGEALVEAKSLKNITDKFLKFIEYAKAVSELDLAELYTNTFDFTKESSLYLTYYDYAEQQERGMALYKLKEKYSEAGLILINNELPDFLPLVLEFTASAGKKEILADFYKALQNIYEYLSKENNPYVNVFEGVLILLGDEKTIQKSGKKAVDSNKENISGEVLGRDDL